MSHAQTDFAGAARGSYGSYAVGFLLSLFLTALSFGLVMCGMVSRPAALAGIVAAAVVQFLVHLHYFLHLDRSSAMRWNAMALLFTLLILILFVGGSIWIMTSLNYRMM
jgi:cytochrome o ubiquinol oxidase operon protein cyoD